MSGFRRIGRALSPMRAAQAARAAGGMDHRGAALGDHRARVADHEGVLPTGFAFDQHVGFGLERPVEIVDAVAVQGDAAQCDEQARSRAAAARCRTQPAVHRHRLRAVLAQVHRVQAVAMAQRMVGRDVVVGLQHDAACIGGDDALPQAHAALVRHQARDRVARLRQCRVDGGRCHRHGVRRIVHDSTALVAIAEGALS
jgi:hypothetical protein